MPTVSPCSEPAPPGTPPAHTPARTWRSRMSSLRFHASNSASAWLATSRTQRSGMLTTITPSSVAAGTSMTSYPTPVRTTVLRCSSALITARVIGEKTTTSASASRPRAMSVSGSAIYGSVVNRAGTAPSAVWQSLQSRATWPWMT